MSRKRYSIQPIDPSKLIDPRIAGIIDSKFRGCDELTQMQRVVLAHVIDGLKNVDIATRLGISRRTVEDHRRKLLKAVDVLNTAQLIKEVLLPMPSGGISQHAIAAE